MRRKLILRKYALQLSGKLLHPCIQIGLHRRSSLFEPPQARTHRRHIQRMPYKSTRKERHAMHGIRLVAILPLATIERIHKVAVARQRSHGHTAADHLAIRRHIGLYAIERLRPTLQQTESVDHFVEDKRRLALMCNRTELMQKLRWPQLRMTALNRLHKNRSKLMS